MCSVSHDDSAETQKKSKKNQWVNSNAVWLAFLKNKTKKGWLKIKSLYDGSRFPASLICTLLNASSKDTNSGNTLYIVSFLHQPEFI